MDIAENSTNTRSTHYNGRARKKVFVPTVYAFSGRGDLRPFARMFSWRLVRDCETEARCRTKQTLPEQARGDMVKHRANAALGHYQWTRVERWRELPSKVPECYARAFG